ncbi:hypothetical protein HOV93_52010 [Planctomycetes bacterium FF15]|uniref:Transposase n=1 Tax=Bremerella alba TaxID=980252 RepID=A0A7V8VAK0_9BACT|nr:hypothetical protein [Bremerella alba]
MIQRADAQTEKRDLTLSCLQVETEMSMIKRRQGNFVRGKTEPSRDQELHLMVLTHNVMILWWACVFYRADLTPFPSPISIRRQCHPSAIVG